MLAERGPISVISAIRKIRNPLVLFSARPIRPHCAASYGIPKFRDQKKGIITECRECPLGLLGRILKLIR
jgi:hypothetical protein